VLAALQDCENDPDSACALLMDGQIGEELDESGAPTTAGGVITLARITDSAYIICGTVRELIRR
jgi:hypothetical protein